MQKKKGRKVVVLEIVLLIAIVAFIAIAIYYISPVITLNGDEKTTVNFGEEYKEEGAKARFLFFDVSNDITTTDNIDIEKPGIYSVIYKVENKIFKQKGTVTRTVTIKDTTPPEINILGDSKQIIYQNTSYVESGYKAVDNIDGDITDKVTVENNIDIKTVGDYVVKYTVIDSNNNSSSITRQVSVIAKTATSNNENGLPVLMYHYFYDSSIGEVGENANFIEIHNFEEQVKYLKENGYYFPTWSEVNAYLDGSLVLPQKSIVITSDDSNESFFRLAVPVIEKYQVKATSFAIGIYVNSEIITAYGASGNIYFQSHTYDMHKAGCTGMNHGGYFNCVSYDEGLNDLKKEIELIKTTDAIAYPFGDVNGNIKQITKDAGISMGFTTEYGRIYPGMDKLELPRVRVNGGITIQSFINIVS